MVRPEPGMVVPESGLLLGEPLLLEHRDRVEAAVAAAYRPDQSQRPLEAGAQLSGVAWNTSSGSGSAFGCSRMAPAPSSRRRHCSLEVPPFVVPCCRRDAPFPSLFGRPSLNAFTPFRYSTGCRTR